MIDILFLAWNRLEYVRFSFETLLRNTDWDIVDKLTVSDDGSEDGTYEYLEEALLGCPADATLVRTSFRSPTRSMLFYLERPRAEMWAKIDCDILLPPGWLTNMHEVLTMNPWLELLGMEAGMAGSPPRDWDGSYDVTESSHIGGVGLFRTKAFKTHPSIQPNGRFGFDHWQQRFFVRRGWITPDLPVLSLDRIPFEPWLSLSHEYDVRHWHRAAPWPKYSPLSPHLESWVEQGVLAP